MKCVEFEGVNVRIAENQPEYETIPAHHGAGIMTFCWELSDEELAHVIKTKKIWHQVKCGHGSIQPQILVAAQPRLISDGG